MKMETQNNQKVQPPSEEQIKIVNELPYHPHHWVAVQSSNIHTTRGKNLAQTN